MKLSAFLASVLISFFASISADARVPVSSQAWFYTGMTEDNKTCRVEFYYQDSNQRFEIGISTSYGIVPYGDGWFQSIQLNASPHCQYTEASEGLVEKYRTLWNGTTFNDVVLSYHNAERTKLDAVTLHSAFAPGVSPELQCERLTNQVYVRSLSCFNLKGVEL